MFRKIAGILPGGAEQLFRLHPMQLNGLLELAWDLRIHNNSEELGHPDRRSEIPGIPKDVIDKLLSVAEINRNRFKEVRWDHLIYAYMIENTRIYEIFRKVISEYLHGEQLGAPSPESQHWLRNTEELFFRTPASYSIYSVVSDIRPDLQATRRELYFNMFGMDLNHGGVDNKPYPFNKPESSNRGFTAAWNAFLKEVWIGISNFGNTSGAKPTDDATIANLASKLHDMLLTRRQNGNFSREEFFFVSMMSWFHLTVEFNSPIIISLRANAVSATERSYKVGGRVNIAAHGKSENFFRLADAMSRILIQIETGIYNEPAAVQALYTPANGGPEADMRQIISEWSNSTGHNLKAPKEL